MQSHGQHLDVQSMPTSLLSNVKQVCNKQAISRLSYRSRNILVPSYICLIIDLRELFRAYGKKQCKLALIFTMYHPNMQMQKYCQPFLTIPAVRTDLLYACRAATHLDRSVAHSSVKTSLVQPAWIYYTLMEPLSPTIT